mmetsp:Transcript_1584/g.3939  ORF Transcript_1584/g.3939 Transcript_1584/m.3939 type:complete len:284 (+) Transcript_1584:637-1488(+)
MTTRVRTGMYPNLAANIAIVLYLTVTKAGLTRRRAPSLFGVSEQTAGRAFITALDALHMVLKECMPTLATEKLHKLIPERVREALETSGEDADVNPVHLLDAFEAFTEAPFGDLARAILWSAYKHHYTAKFLLGILSNGATYFVSKAYGGAVSDRLLTEISGFLDVVKPFEDVLADKGFYIHDLLSRVGSILWVPPKLRPGRGHQPTQEEDQTSSIAQQRIFVENGVERVKDFEIFHFPIKISNIHLLSKVVFVCAMLTNELCPFVSARKSQAERAAAGDGPS